jgi:hypothetical protein
MTNATQDTANNSHGAGYENAPATRLLATHCACCGRPLLDARSVECGVGPVCRRNYGYNEIAEDVRVAANRHVYRIACLNSGHPAECDETIVAHLTALSLLGCYTIANKVAANIGALEIVTEDMADDSFGLRSPYNPEAVRAMRGVPGRRWDRDAKLNTFPRSSWFKLAEVVLEHYGAGSLLRTADGRLVQLQSANESPGFEVPAPPTADEPADDEAEIVIRTRGNTMYVRTPYNRAAVATCRSIRGRKYQGDGVNSFPTSQRDAVMAMIANHYPGFSIDDGAAAAVSSDRPAWANVDLSNAPDAEYDPRSSAARVALAEEITALLKATGCTKLPPEELPRRCDEDVYAKHLGDEVYLRIYTSIKDGACRTVGADAVRVCAVKRAPARSRARWNGVARTTRVNRTGTIAACVSRVLERMVDVAAEVATPAL